eukprot:maker-scaffold1150_size58936-snap-gene-0.14 protein:Tk05053 transcript:maker-scaffold1150_size58936-snap-gene-0.14-mRNA-1 annotation:"hypothetical protein"
MSSLAGTSFQRSVAFDLSVSEERNSSSSSSSSSSEEGDSLEQVRNEQKILERVEEQDGSPPPQSNTTDPHENSDQVDVGPPKKQSPTESVPNTAQDKDPKDPSSAHEQPSSLPLLLIDDGSTSEGGVAHKPKSILKAWPTPDPLRNFSFPHSTEAFLLQLGINPRTTEHDCL